MTASATPATTKPATKPTGQQIAVAGVGTNWKDYVAKYSDQLREIAAENTDIKRLYRITTSAIRADEKLLKCSVSSVFGAMQKAAQCGLEPNSPLGECYIVPFWNSKLNCFEAQYMTGYRGLIVLARRSGFVTTVSAGAVYKGDIFEVERGLQEKLRHIPKFGQHKDEEITHVWAVGRLKGGDAQFDVMTREDVLKIQARSKAGDSGPWKTDWAEMARKTVFRRLSKYLPMSIQLARVIEEEEREEAEAEWEMGPAPARIEIPQTSGGDPFDEDITDIEGEDITDQQ